MTTPLGMKSVAVQGVEYFYPSTIIGIIKPKVCASKVKPETPKSPPFGEEDAAPDGQCESKGSCESSSANKPSVLMEEENPDPPR